MERIVVVKALGGGNMATAGEIEAGEGSANIRHSNRSAGADGPEARGRRDTNSQFVEGSIVRIAMDNFL